MTRTENFDAFSRVVNKYAVGQKVVRPVVSVVENLGVFVALEPDFHALIHVSKIRGLALGEALGEFFAVGQSITSEIIYIDLKNCRVQLSTVLRDEDHNRKDAVVEFSFNEFLTSEFQVVARAVNIDDLDVLGGSFQGAWIWGCDPNVRKPAQVTNVQRAEKDGARELLLQLQSDYDEYLKVVHVTLRQRGDDVVARADWACWESGSTHEIGYDFEINRGNQVPIATSATGQGYGVSELRLAHYPGRSKVTVSEARSNRRRIPTPSAEEMALYNIGQTVDVEVFRVVPYGIFTVLPSGGSALLHVSKIDNLGGHPLEAFFHPGDHLTVRIGAIDRAAGYVQLAYAMPADSSLGTCAQRSPAEHAAAWANGNSRESQAAHEWLVRELKNRPLHPSLLNKLTLDFGVPKPVSAWIRQLDDVALFSAVTSPIRQPAVAYKASVGDESYWNAFATSWMEPTQPAEIPPCRAEVLESSVAPKTPSAPDGTKHILIDASNIIKCFAHLKSRALMILKDALRASGYEPTCLFDANIRYALKEMDDAEGLEKLESALRDDREHNIIVPSGTRSDDFLLLLSDRHGYPICSCDAFKDEAFEKYAWLRNRVESGEKRVHAPSFILGDLLIPTLGIVWSFND